jgi:hypothetical protein
VRFTLRKIIRAGLVLKLERNEIAYIIRYFSKLRERAKERTRSLMKKRREKLIGERRTIIHKMIMICVRNKITD